MQHLRVLILLLVATAACATQRPAPEQPKAAPSPTAVIAAATPVTPAAGSAAAAASGASAPAIPKMKVGEALAFDQELSQVLPTPGKVNLTQRNGRPVVLFFWSSGNLISREDLVAFDQWVKRVKLREKMDAYAVAGFSTEKGSAADAKDMATILGISDLPVLGDPDVALSKRIGADQFPEMVVISSEGKLLARALRGIDHPNLQVSAGDKGETKIMSAADYLLAVAAQGDGPSISRTPDFNPADRLLNRKYPDFEAPLFSPIAWGKGQRKKLSSLLSGQRPAVLLFFSSTCEHCQHDMPQILQLLKDKPGLYDVVGITRIKNEQHRKVSVDYFERMAIPFPILEDTGAVMDLFKVTSTPTDIYLSPGGTIQSISYYQHADLATDWTKKAALLAGVPDAAPPPKAKGWTFPLKLKNEAGKEVDLASMAGKPTLLHFWATWCAPCRKELPDLIARLPALKAAGNVVIASVEDDPTVIAKYRKDSGLTFDSLAAPHDGLAAKVDFARSVPRTYLLDPAGKVIAVYQGSYEWADEEKFGRVLGRMN